MKNIKTYIKNNKKKTILLGILLFLFLTISLLVITEKTNYIDIITHSYIINIRNENLTSFLTILTNLAGASFLLAISIILIIIIKNKKIPLYILINLVSAFITNEITKSLFTRSRPVGINLINETGYSFPSGHSMVSLSFYGYIVYLLLNKIESKKLKIFLISCLIIFVSLIGFSRIYLGVHYLSDVIAGFLLSTIYLIIFTSIIKLEKK